MATPKRKADDNADLDESAAKQARLLELQGVAEDGTAEEEPAANGKGYVACLHEVSYPEGYDHARVPSSTKPTKEYPFTLDPFQREAVRCLEAGEPVLVSAHTSAGKTVVAEYAIAMALRDKQRVVYTSPIKALSNQKYREMLEEFTDVGLMTGDVTISPNASCLAVQLSAANE